MSKIVLILLTLGLLFLSGYSVYKIMPVLKIQIATSGRFPELSKLLEITPQPSPSSTPSSSPTTTPAFPIFSDKELQSFTDYLIKNVSISTHQGQVYCAFDLLPSSNDNTSILYLWTVCQEYYRRDKDIITGDGISLPVSLSIIKDGENLNIISYRAPRAGDDYQSDLKAIFPETLLISKIISPDGFMIDNLIKQIEIQKQSFYKI